MNTKVKRLIAIIISLILAVNFATTVSAVQPRYLFTKSITYKLSFNGTTANCSIDIYGSSSVTSITEVNITLTDSHGNSVGSWNNLSSTEQDFSFFRSVSNLTKGEQYTLSFTAKVNTNNSSEPVSGSTSNVCPK